MAYESVDKLQNVLADSVFHYAKDKKKAAGRALGTIVEIITFYLLKSWDSTKHISIERGLAEYGNSEITHNVEYSLHPVIRETILSLQKSDKSLTANSILKELENSNFDLKGFIKTSNLLVNKDLILRNACTIANSDNSFLLCNLTGLKSTEYLITVCEQDSKPFAIFECKRVGVEEGVKKGPQTIEKAKQGAYVARSASSLQKIRTENGELYGIIYKSDNTFDIKPYYEFIQEIIFSNNAELLRKFILTIGVVSNHGNWFTSDNQNKELKVLAQSYDWLLFLTDKGLSEFIENLILKPAPKYKPIRDSFISSYSEGKKKNQFTKVQINLQADRLLTDFFIENNAEIEKWFNIISPMRKKLTTLKEELVELQNKNWLEILK